MNPYTAPETNEPLAIDSDSPFAHLDFKQVKKLYYRSCNLSCIAVLALLGALAVGWLTWHEFTNGDSEPGDFVTNVWIGLIVIYLLTFIGLINRPIWGKVFCIITCILSICSIAAANVIGLLVGLAGLFACFGSPQLFGKNRFLHKDLKKEFKTRKAAEKTAKKNAR